MSIKRSLRKITRKLKGKKGKLRLAVVLGGIIIVILIAALITGVFYNPETDYYVPPKEIAEWDLPTPKDDETKNSAVASDKPAAYESSEPKPSEEQKQDTGTVPQETVDKTTKPEKDPDAFPTPGLNEPAGEVPGQASENEDDIIVPLIEDAEDIDELWIENKIKEHEAEIDPKDLEDFRAILAKLDQAFIKELAIDGFTNEEAVQLINHMKQNLTDKEYVRSKELFKRYNYLLEDI